MKLFKKSEVDYSQLSEEELSALFMKKARKQKIIYYTKKALLILFLLLAVIGGYKALFTVKNNAYYEESENQTFVKTYVQEYYAYPQTDETKEYLSRFSLADTTTGGLSYDHAIENAKLSNVQIYKVKTKDPLKEIYTYYLYGDLETKKKDEDAASTRIDFNLDVVKSNNSFLVVSPINHRTIEVSAIEGKELRDQFKFDPKDSSLSCNEEEKKEIEETIKLFFSTYADNQSQAELLVVDKEMLDSLDKNTVLELLQLNSVTKDDTSYYIKASINEKVSSLLTQAKNVYFVIDIEKNKIEKMEVY